MFPYRGVLVRMRQGDTDREIADAFVIQTTKGAPYTASGVRGAILLAAEQAGLAPPRNPGQKKPSAAGFTAKDLRAYAASTAKRQGYTLEQLKAGLAHTSITRALR